MAYLREYQMVAQGVGDPGFLSGLKRRIKIPKRLRKMKVGRAALGLAGAVFPGLGPVVGMLAPQRSEPQVSPETVAMLDQLRALGIVGDPGMPLGFLSGIGGLVQKAGTFVGKATKGPLGALLPLILSGAASGAAGAGIGAMLGGGRGGARGRHRRMDVGNVKALRRSMRRVEGFAKLARSTISFTKQTRMKAKGRKR